MYISRSLYSSWMAKTQREKLKQIISKVRPRGRILDVGCGPGFLEEQVQAVATDIDIENLKKAKGLKVLCSGDDLPFKHRTFDWVFCIDTVHLLKSVDGMVKVAKRGGKLVVSAFCSPQNSHEKMQELKERFPRFDAVNEFFTETENELDAVLVLRAPTGRPP